MEEVCNMQIVHGESDLKGTKWCVEDVVNLQTRLTNEEFEENITNSMADMDRLVICSNILNNRQALPARYKELVKDYAGSSKADPDNSVIF
jgi:hypothetical protein